MFKNWKNRILDHKEIPPEGIWDSISKKMDSDKEAEEEMDIKVPEFVSRITEYETILPANAWDNIVAELDKDDETTAASQNKKGKLVAFYSKFAVAAAVAGIIITLLINNDKGEFSVSNGLASNTSNIKHSPVIIPAKQIIATNTIDTKKEILQTDNVKKKTSPNFNEPVDDVETIAYTNTGVEPLTADPFANTQKIANSNGEIITDLDHLGAPNTYVMASLGPNGESVRVSTKLSAYMGYLADRSTDTEENLDKIIKGSSVWKVRLKQWREKLSNSAVSPSYNNFLDVFELSNLLDENKIIHQ